MAINLNYPLQDNTNSKPSKKEGKEMMLYKSSKVFIGVFVLAMLITINIKAQQWDCLRSHTPEVAECEFWTAKIRNIVLSEYGPQYGNCQLTIGYFTRTCNVVVGQCTTKLEQFFMGYVEWYMNPECQDFWNFITNNGEIYPEAVKLLYIDIAEHSMDYHFLDYYTKLTSQEQLAMKCDGTYPNCDMPSCIAYKSSYISGKCQDACYDYTSSPFKITFSDCEVEPPMCCIYTSRFCPCYDAQNNLVQIEKIRSSYADGGECSGAGPLEENCIYGPGQYKYYQPCFSICPEDE